MKTINLLVIEDSKDLVVTMGKYFEENTNIRIKWQAHDGEEAIRLIASKKDEYDLILLEPLIPKKDGLSILEYMKDKKINKKVLILSSYKDNDILKRTEEFNIVYYMLKPFELQLLEKRIISIVTNTLSDGQILQYESIELQKQTTKIIHELGVPSNLKGYNYLREGIILVYNDPNLAHKITTSLYPKIADKYASTVSRVERSMRHAIEVSWNRGNWDMMEEIFGYSVSIDKSKPTNSEFIVTIADCLRLQNNKSNI